MTTGRLDSGNTSRSTLEDTTNSAVNYDQHAQGASADADAGKPSDKRDRVARLIRRMRVQIWAGAIGGFIVALAIGAAFIAVVSGGITLH